MNKKLHIIIDNLNHNVYDRATVTVPNWATMSIETLLGFYTDFDYNCLVKKELVDTLPTRDIKLYFNLCYFPDDAPCIWMSDKETVEKINKDKNSFLWMFSPHEAVFRPDELLDIIKKSGIDIKKIIFTCSSVEYNNKIFQGLKFINIPEWWEAQYRHHLKKYKNVSFITPDEKLATVDNASKKVLTLNRNVKGHRVWFYHSLINSELFNESHVSYHVPDLAKKDGFTDEGFVSWIRQECKRLPEHIVKQILEDERIFKSKTLDDLSTHLVINHNESILPYYHDSLVSIVTESVDDIDFLTEKTFKAIMHCHPFIIVGTPQMTQSLKDRGYKTYESLFGQKSIETYEDSVKLLRKLHSMPLEKYKYLIKNRYKDMIEYNWNHFMTREISWKPVEERLIRAAS